MPHLNQITVVGHAGKDFEVRPVGDTKVAKFSVAVTEYRKKGNEFLQDTTWFPVEAWGYAADKAERKFEKGAVMIVTGSMKENRFEGKDGTKKSKWFIKASAVDGTKKTNTGAAATPSNMDHIPF